MNNWNISAAKRIPIYKETHALEIRSQLLNAFNHTPWYTPDRNLTSPTYGRITSTRPARQIQFTLRDIF